MTADRCPDCEAAMHELYCYDCVTLERNSVLTAPAETLRKSHCAQGHAFTPENTRIDGIRGKAGGYQVCRKCHNEHCARRRARKAAERAAS